MAVVTAKVVAEAPTLDQGDSEAKPNPAPSDSRISVTAAAATAPPMIADQLSAEPELSSVTISTSERSTDRSMTITSLPSMPEEGEKDDDRNRHTEQPKQNTATHGNLHCDVPKEHALFGIVAYTCHF